MDKLHFKCNIYAAFLQSIYKLHLKFSWKFIGCFHMWQMDKEKQIVFGYSYI